MTKLMRQLLPFATLVLICCALFAIVPDKFFSYDNIMNILRRSSVNGIMAVGMTAVIITAGIDLSVGSMLAMSGMLGAFVMIGIGGDNPAGISLWIGSLACLIVAAGSGFLNGILVTKLKLAPFIVTLGTMSIFRGVAYLMNNGTPYNIQNYDYLGNGMIGPVPISVVIFAVVVAVAAYTLKYTPFGRHTYAIGSNREAAYHAGIDVDRSLIRVYTLTGLIIILACAVDQLVRTTPLAWAPYARGGDEGR